MTLDGVTNLILFIVEKKPRGIFPRIHIYPLNICKIVKIIFIYDVIISHLRN